MQLSHEHRRIIASAMQVLHPKDRAPFLNAVVDRLRGLVEIGDGTVGRIVRETQRQFFRAPVVEHE